MKMIANNKKAYYDYDVLDKVEAGVLLKGWEVKSLKSGSVNISNAFIKEKNAEMYLTGARIPLWKSSMFQDKEDEFKDRKLLIHKSQIKSLTVKAKQQGNTIVPLEIYANDKGLIKILLALVKGKKQYDKKNKIKDREHKRALEGDRKAWNL